MIECAVTPIVSSYRWDNGTPDQCQGIGKHERLWQKRAKRNGVLPLRTTRCQDHLQSREMVEDILSKLDAVRGTRHVDIGEHQVYRVASNEIGPRLVGSRGLDDMKTFVTKPLGNESPNEDLVFDCPSSEHLAQLAA